MDVLQLLFAKEIDSAKQVYIPDFNKPTSLITIHSAKKVYISG